MTTRTFSFFLSLLFFIPVLLLAQPSATVSGEILHAESSIVEVAYPAHFLSREPSLFSSDVEKDGQFEIQFPLSEARVINFQCGDALVELFLEPGDHVRISLDAENPSESLSFAQDKAQENQFMLAYIEKYARDERQEQVLFEHLTSDSPEEFQVFGNNWREEQQQFVESFQQDQTFSSSFKSYWQREIDYTYVGLMLQKLEMYARRPIGMETDQKEIEKVPLSQLLSGISFQEDEAIHQVTYINAVSAYFRYKLRQLMSDRIHLGDYRMGENMESLLQTAEILFQGKTQDMVVAMIYADAISQGGLDEMQESFDAFVKEKKASMPGPVEFLQELAKTPPQPYMEEIDPE